MTDVMIDKQKIDLLANAISVKSGEPVTMTLDEMVEAVDGIEVGGTPNLQAKTYTVDSAGIETITADSGYDGLSEVEVTVPQGEVGVLLQSEYLTQSGALKWRIRGMALIETGDYSGTPGFIEDNSSFVCDWNLYNAIPSGTSITPTESAQTVGGTNYMMKNAVTVNAIPSSYVGSGITRRDSTNLTASGATVSVPSGYYASNASKSVSSGTEGAPTATKGTVSNHSVSVTPSVTNSAGYISGGTKTGTAVSVSASELVSGTYTVSASGTHDVTNYASASVAAGSATASASKGAVSNHSVSITPSVTRTAGYISAGSANGTAVTVAASELVSGTKSITENGTGIDVTNYASVDVNVSGGSGSSVQVGTKTTTLPSTASSISFTGLSGNPSSFVITSQSDVATNTDGVTAVVYDGTSLHGQTMTTQVEADTGFTKSYSSGTLTITATTAQFQANAYKLAYTYDGSSSDIHTSDVQVGSGATSITFSSLSGRPMYWSCIFKSNFSTSSGYQRVIAVANDGSSIYGLDMDSSAHAATAWTATYSGGNLTISSGGTNNGGYFHQPGYYQLTYAVDDSAPQYQAKSAYATTTAQTITPDSGYDALESVSIGAVSQTNLTAANIKSGTTVTISNGQSNLWSVTGTYTGGGGGSASVASTTWTNSSNTTTSHQFSSLSGTPKAAFLRCTSSLSRSSSSSNYFIADMVWDGESCTGNSYRRSNGSYANVTSGYSVTTGSNSITFTSSGTSTTNPGSFYNGTYELVYVY